MLIHYSSFAPIYKGSTLTDQDATYTISGLTTKNWHPIFLQSDENDTYRTDRLQPVGL